MGIVVEAAQVLAVLVQGARLVPPLGDARIVLPGVEELEVLVVLPVDDFEREVLVYFGDVAAVHDGADVRLRTADGVARVDWLVGKLHRDLVVLGHERVLGQRRAQRPVCAVSYHPDWTRTRRRCGTLPECTSEDQQLFRARVEVVCRTPWLRMLYCQAGRKQFASDDFLFCPQQGKSEILVRRMGETDCVDDVPDLTQRRRAVSCPLEDCLRAATCSCPGAVVG